MTAILISMKQIVELNKKQTFSARAMLIFLETTLLWLLAPSGWGARGKSLANLHW